MRDTCRSKELYDRAKRLMPGGVSSPVRAFAPYPIYISRGKGSRVWDVDGNEYIDYCMAFGPLILGHAHPSVVKAVQEQAENGTLYGAPIEKEIELAEMISRYYPSIQMVRFVSSGTEATMHVLRLARGYTGRDKVIKVEGAFHGAHDAVLVKAGSGATTHSVPNSLGIPAEVTKNTLLAPFNDIPAVEKIVKENKNEIAALIIEPVIGNAGPILPDEDYLASLRELTSDEGILLIFDEVITGFRLAMGGAQEYFGVKPDLTTLGKIAGGGMPLGIFGGPEEIMSMISPTGKVYQAGTFSGNPMSLAAGIATIKELARIGHWELNRRGEALRKGIEGVVNDLRLDFTVAGIGSMFQLFMTKGPIRNYEDAKKSDTALFNRLFRGLLEKGIYLPPSQFETNFLSTAHSDDDIERTVNAFDEVLREITR
ncbi:MAG: glutamate-1-semialdehyde 2,1-aminomutase [Methanomassiliicoccales archaeon]|jgi:glutamate-1-semialdehyde 2,1-aminomutase|nr:glutamate-1-semialdehyde 2,1-aminomutase [Methanomassiliicoccales archaeon]